MIVKYSIYIYMLHLNVMSLILKSIVLLWCNVCIIKMYLVLKLWKRDMQGNVVNKRIKFNLIQKNEGVNFYWFRCK